MITNAYDGFGRLASSIIDLGWIARTLTYQYDANGARTRITHPDGTWFASTYDGLDRPVLLSSPQSWLVHAGYNAAGLPQVISRSNDTWSGRYYDGIQRLAAFDLMPIGAPHGVSWTFDRNPAGQISVIARSNPGSGPGQADDYAWTGHYEVNRNYTSNGLNQYSAAGGANFDYDDNGNLTSDGSRTYTYDIENRLISASPGVTLSYDPLGRLFQVASGAGTTTFLYDGDALVAEYDGAHAMTRRYAHSVGADVPMVEYTSASVADPHHLFPDHQGSIVAATGAGGTLLFRNAYDEYGIPGAANAGRFQYTGQIWLPELGMYYYKARIYSPTLGRFLQTDPIGYDDQFNLYAYVGNDPVNRTDPSGEGDHCDSTPGQCGMRRLTQAEEQRRDRAYRTVGKAAASIIPVFRIARWLLARFARSEPAQTTARQGTATGSTASNANRIRSADGVPRSARGPGSVHPSQRDPKRYYTRDERAARLEAQRGRCANCNERTTLDDSVSHHRTRHADGGPTDDPNQDVVCLRCHGEIHNGRPQ